MKMTTTTATIGLRAGIGMAGAGAAEAEGVMISADDEEYWAAFPPHIKNFVRSVWAQAPFESPGDEKAKAQAMYAIAQQMVQSGKTTHTTNYYDRYIKRGQWGVPALITIRPIDVLGSCVHAVVGTSSRCIP
jgi:hypothetical protein